MRALLSQKVGVKAPHSESEPSGKEAQSNPKESHNYLFIELKSAPTTVETKRTESVGTVSPLTAAIVLADARYSLSSHDQVAAALEKVWSPAIMESWEKNLPQKLQQLQALITSENFMRSVLNPNGIGKFYQDEPWVVRTPTGIKYPKSLAETMDRLALILSSSPTNAVPIPTAPSGVKGPGPGGG